MRRLVAFLAIATVMLPLSACARRATPVREAWRTLITPADKGRLRDWRATWMLALAQARGNGAGGRIDAEGVLLDPDAGLADPDLPDGWYACRTIKVGRQAISGPAYAASPPFTCRVAAGRLTRIDGPQRPAGTLWPFDPTRLIFLGSMALSDETRALDYGRDHDRDMIGVVERIGPDRWRLALPRPHWESLLDVIELRPKLVSARPAR